MYSGKRNYYSIEQTAYDTYWKQCNKAMISILGVKVFLSDDDIQSSRFLLRESQTYSHRK